MDSIAVRSARLTTGTLSVEKQLNDILASMSGSSAVAPGQSPVPRSLGEDDGGWRQTGDVSEETVLERAAWQAFLLYLQMTFPDMAAELDPGHKIARLPFVRVTLTVDAIDLLNMMIANMYGGEVEIHTIEVGTRESRRKHGNVACHIGVPFRPVTGLNVIVVPTTHYTLSRSERAILRVKEEFSRSRGIAGLDTARALYAHKEWRSSPSPPPRRPSSSLWGRLVSAGGKKQVRRG